METRIQTIMFIDMQGYTKRSAKQTIEEMKLFHDEFHGFVKGNLEKHSGILVKTLGDGFLARFDSPTLSVQCAVEMQKKLASRNANMFNPESIVNFRIGINTGDVGIDESGDLFGDPVNIASRIQTFAEPNEVYISESTNLAMNQNEFGTKDLGPQMFKNATREIKVYKIIKDPKEAAEKSSPEVPKQQVSGSRLNWKPFMMGLVGGVFIIVLLAGIFRGISRKKTKMNPEMNPPVLAGTKAKPDKPAPGGSNQEKDDVSGDDYSKNDILDLDLDNLPPGMNIPPKQMKILRQIQELRSKKDFAGAMSVAEQHVGGMRNRNQLGHGQFRFFIMLGRLAIESGDKKKGESYFNEALNSIPDSGGKREKLSQFVEGIKKKYP